MKDEIKPIHTRDDPEPRKIRDATAPLGFWDRTKTWAANNRTISGALVGGAAGAIVPGIGPLFGAIVGAGVGFASSKERREEFAPGAEDRSGYDSGEPERSRSGRPTRAADPAGRG